MPTTMSAHTRFRGFSIASTTLLLALALSSATAQSLEPLLLGGRHVLETDEVHTGPVTAVGAALTIERGARMDGSVTVVGGSLTVRGHAAGPVHAYATSVRLEDGAVVDGPLALAWSDLERGANVQLRDEVRREAGLPVAFGSPVRLDAPWRTPRSALGGGEIDPYAVLVQGLLLALFAFILVRLTPQRLDGIGDVFLGHPGPSLLTGLLAFLAVTAAAVLFAITLIGIPMALLIGAATWLAVLAGAAALGDRLGLRLWPQARDRGGRAALGTFVLAIGWAALGALPVLGGLARAALGVALLGAVVRSRIGTVTPAGREAVGGASPRPS